ncbi:hypothetical protein BYT27DRAFT_7301074 [Phlegmacium glaucopus]|nr:hypothetical protein BYT27DRAFT_7301074 [Phlegmacium glaucopus]
MYSHMQNSPKKLPVDHNRLMFNLCDCILTAKRDIQKPRQTNRHQWSDSNDTSVNDPSEIGGPPPRRRWHLPESARYGDQLRWGPGTEYYGFAITRGVGAGLQPLVKTEDLQFTNTDSFTLEETSAKPQFFNFCVLFDNECVLIDPLFDNHAPNLRYFELHQCAVDFTSPVLTLLTELYRRRKMDRIVVFGEVEDSQPISPSDGIMMKATPTCEKMRTVTWD